MLRTKLILLVLVLVGGLTAIFFFPLVSEYESFATQALMKDVQTKLNFFAREQREVAEAFMREVQETAADKNLLKAIKTPPDPQPEAAAAPEGAGSDGTPAPAAEPKLTQRHDKVFEEVAVVTARVDAAVVYVIGPDGKVLARNIEYRQWGMSMLDEPLVKAGLQGKTTHRYYIEKGASGRLVWAVGTPIKDPDTGESLGALMIGRVVSDKMAKERANFLSTDFAYLLPNRLVAASLGPMQKAGFDAYLKQGSGKDITEVVKQGQFMSPAVVEFGGESYAVMLAPLKSNLGEVKVGYAVLSSVDRALTDVRKVKAAIPILGLLFLIFGILGAMLIANSVYKPLDNIEQGIFEIISGRQDYEFKPTTPSIDGSLASALNVMLATLLGRPVSGEDSGEAGEWNDPLFGSAQGGKAKGRPKVVGLKWKGKKRGKPAAAPAAESAPAPEAAAPAAEEAAPAAEPAPAAEAAPAAPEPATPSSDGGPALGSDAYYQQVYDEFIAAKQELGEETKGVTFAGFVAKLKDSEEMVKQKYKCDAVKFQVVVKDNRVSLQPLIPKSSSTA